MRRRPGRAGSAAGPAGTLPSMRLVELLRHPSASERATLVGFVDELTERTGRRPLSDHLWLALAGDQDERFVAVRAADAERTLALALIVAGNDSASLEVAVRPDLADTAGVADDVASTAIDGFRAAGGGPLYWWVDDPTDTDIAFAARHGLDPSRSLFEMRRPLPADRRSSVTTRAFRPGADEAAWLRVNNRAFAEHPEQGGWTAETLRSRMRESWFDPDGFRLHEIDGVLAAFCWTKLHTDEDPPVGEIYAIAVDPEHHGRGLGRELTLAGLDWISEQGVRTANLYVDGANEAAVQLYRTLGFAVHRTRQAFGGVITTD